MIVMIASSAIAAESEHAGSLKSWIYQIINFAVLVFILVKFLGKPMKNYFAQRKELIEKSISESQQAKELAQKALQEVEEKLKLKDKEVQDILDTAKKLVSRRKRRLFKTVKN